MNRARHVRLSSAARVSLQHERAGTMRPLSPEHAERVSRDVSRQLSRGSDRAQRDDTPTDEQLDAMEHPYAKWATGLHECPLCLREVDDPGLCDRCGPVVDRDEPGYEDWR